MLLASGKTYVRQRVLVTSRNLSYKSVTLACEIKVDQLFPIMRIPNTVE